MYLHFSRLERERTHISTILTYNQLMSLDFLCFFPISRMSNLHENGEYHADITGGKQTEVGSEGLKKRIQRHYNMSAEQFLKVWCVFPQQAPT